MLCFKTRRRARSHILKSISRTTLKLSMQFVHSSLTWLRQKRRFRGTKSSVLSFNSNKRTKDAMLRRYIPTSRRKSSSGSRRSIRDNTAIMQRQKPAPVEE
eukprot:1278378-Rhodomonas_salina.1